MIITAAGISSRQKENKLLIRSCNETMIEKTINTFLNKVLSIFVVVGHQKELMIPIITNRFRNDIIIVDNNNYKSGIASSLKVGILKAGENYDYYGFCNGDKPFINAKTINRLINYLEGEKPKILIPLYQKKGGHPTFFSKDFIREFSLISGDTGGREVVKKYQSDVVYLPIEDEGVVLDMDKYLNNE